MFVCFKEHRRLVMMPPFPSRLGSVFVIDSLLCPGPEEHSHYLIREADLH